MYCYECGKELREGAKFCTSCGSPVDRQLTRSDSPQDTPSDKVNLEPLPAVSAKDEELLFESKGIGGAQSRRSVLCAIILAICGAALLGLANARHSTGNVGYYAMSGGNRTLINVGQLGGGYMLNSDGRNLLTYIGLIAIIIAIVIIPLGNNSERKLSVTSLRIFTGHVEGVTTTGNPFSISFSPNQPILVEVISYLITIVHNGQRYVVGVNPKSGKTAPECADLIRSLSDPRSA